MPAPYCCSAARGPTCRWTSWRRRPPSGATRGSSCAAGATTSRCSGPSASRTTASRSSTCSPRHDLPVAGAEQPPRRPGRLRRDRRAATSALLPDYVWGDGEPEGVQRARRRGDDGHRPGGQKLGVGVVARLHRLAARGRYVAGYPAPRPPPCASGFRRRSPAAGTRSSTSAASAACSSPSRCIRGRSPSTCTAPRWCSTRWSGREEFGFTFDPSHLHWQGVDPVEFVRGFADRIFHVHVKDAALTLNGRSGLLGSYLPLGRPAARLGLPGAGPRRHRLGSDHPGAERDRLRRAAVGGVEGRGHGPRVRRRGGVQVRQAAGLRAGPAAGGGTRAASSEHVEG